MLRTKTNKCGDALFQSELIFEGLPTKYFMPFTMLLAGEGTLKSHVENGS